MYTSDPWPANINIHVHVVTVTVFRCKGPVCLFKAIEFSLQYWLCVLHLAQYQCTFKRWQAKALTLYFVCHSFWPSKVCVGRYSKVSVWNFHDVAAGNAINHCLVTKHLRQYFISCVYMYRNEVNFMMSRDRGIGELMERRDRKYELRQEQF